MKTYKYNFNRITGGKNLSGKVETGINIGYITKLSEKKDLAILLGYNIDFFGFNDTLIFQIPELNLKISSIGNDKKNSFFEIGFGIINKRDIGTFYSGISFKKGVYKTNEQIIEYRNNGQNETYHIVSFDDNLSFNLKYFIGSRKSNKSNLN